VDLRELLLAAQMAVAKAVLTVACQVVKRAV